MPGHHSKYTTSRSQAGRKRPRLTSPVRRKKPGFFLRLLRHVPRWAWWIGALAILSVYIAFFYYLFVSPYGFRWRALYGEVNYPEGYDIHGIDVSHYQGDIDWELLRNQGTIDDCPIRFVMIKATEGATKVAFSVRRSETAEIVREDSQVSSVVASTQSVPFSTPWSHMIKP